MAWRLPAVAIGAPRPAVVPTASQADAPQILARAREESSTYVLLKIPSSRQKQLTSREREITLLVGEGLRNQAIAERLEISRATVAAHLRRIFTKLEVKTRTELAHQSMLVV